MSRWGIPRISNDLLNQVDIFLILSTIFNILLAVSLSIFGSLMYPFFILLYLWIAIYVFFIATLIRRENIAERPLIRNVTRLLGLVVLAVLIRLIFIGMSQHISLDALWYIDFGKFMHMGYAPYIGFYFPYPPVFAYIIFIITSFSQAVESFRLFAIAIDAIALVVLWKLVDQEVGPKFASTSAIAYAFLPISIIETGWNGHFEPLVNLFLLLALWFMMQKKTKISGIFLGLAVATKIYPIVVFPILFIYVKGWKNRFWFTISAGVTSALTFAPIFLLTGIYNSSGGSGASINISVQGLFESLFGFLRTIPFPGDIITIGLIAAIILGVIHLMRLISKNDPTTNSRLYHSVTLALGLILIVMGAIAGIYPLLPISRLVYWRLPVDISLVRGITTICVGLLIIVNEQRDWRNSVKKHVSLNSLLVLVGATSLLLIAMTRLFFYGWYLLWSIPFFLLLRDKRLSYTVILCLLLAYPNYTHDNFASLGFEETRQWQDEFVTVEGWNPYINIRGNGVNASQVDAFISSDGTTGRFWFDTRNVSDDSVLNNVSFSYVKAVDFDFKETTEIVAKIAASWDPPFGRDADLSLSFEGLDANGEHIEGDIIPKTSDFTNLTYILWRYSCMNIVAPTVNGTITSLNFTTYPVQRVESSYQIDFIYTTYAGLLNPVYFLIIPSLIAIALAAFTFLHLQFEKERREQ